MVMEKDGDGRENELHRNNEDELHRNNEGNCIIHLKIVPFRFHLNLMALWYMTTTSIRFRQKLKRSNDGN